MRSRVLFRGALCAALLAAAAAAASAGLLAPLRGEGSPPYAVDAPVFFEDDGRARVDLSISVRHQDLQLRTVGNGREGTDLRVELKLARTGHVAVDTVATYRIRRDEVQRDDDTGFSVVTLSVRPQPGRWAMTLRVSDEGVSGGLFSTPPVPSVASGVLEIDRWEGRPPRLSDPEFRIGDRLPHPERVYGIAQDTLEAYVELSAAIPGRAYVVEIEVYDPLHGGMDGESLVLTPQRARSASVYRLPLHSFPAGSYRLRLTPQWNPERFVEAEFGVSWRMERAFSGAREIELEGLLVFDGEARNRFQRLSPAGRLQMLESFWANLDPTPETVANEIYDSFLARVSYAERHFGAFGVHGALTDRGRIYVHYGPPADISFEVLPLNGDELEDSIGKVHDAYRMDRHGTAVKSAVNIAMLDLGQRDAKRNERRIGQEGAFELWTYRLQGDPLFARRDSWAEDLDVRFLFVDRLGTGSYTLEFSNLPTSD